MGCNYPAKRAPRTRFDLRLHGATITVQGLAAVSGLSDVCVRQRLRRGMTPEQIVAAPAHSLRGAMIGSGSERVPLEEFARRLGVSKASVRRRLAEGRTLAEIVAMGGRKRPREDLVGKTFTRLTIVGLAPGDPRKRWQCRCSCGEYRLAYAHDLRKGHQKSCGCLKRDRPAHNKGRGRYLVGCVFGRLRVVEEATIERARRSIRAWICKCQCGSFTKVPTGSLVRGATKSCGCMLGRPRQWTIFGQQLGIEDLAELAGISVGRMWGRLRSMTAIQAIAVYGHQKTGPKRGAHFRVYRWANGQRVTLSELRRLTGLSVKTLIKRLRSGATPEQLAARTVAA